MTLVSTIITDAYREANLIAVGTSETAAQQTEGLRLLNRFNKSLFGIEFGEPLITVNFGDNNVDTKGVVRSDDYYLVKEWFVPLNRRIVFNLESAQEIKLHPRPTDGARFAVSDASGNLSTNNVTVVGNGRTIEAATSLVLSTDSVDREWFYRADLSDWVRMTDLALDNESPFPEEFDDLLIVGLAMRLASRYGVSTVPETADTYRRVLKAFKARYKQSAQVSVDEALLYLSNYYQSFWSSDTAFDRGIA